MGLDPGLVGGVEEGDGGEGGGEEELYREDAVHFANELPEYAALAFHKLSISKSEVLRTF